MPTTRAINVTAGPTLPELGQPDDVHILSGTSAGNRVYVRGSKWEVESHRIAEPVVALVDDGSIVATDASLGNQFCVGPLTADVELANPTNPTNGQVCTWEIIQNATSAKTLSFGTAFAFGAEITAAVISAGLSSHSFISAIYNAETMKWYVRGVLTGY